VNNNAVPMRSNSTGGVSGFNYTPIKKENPIFLVHKEIQNGAVAQSYMTNGLLIYG
jgi:hypothetical protein